MASETVVLVTGAGRGIGRGLMDRYLQRPNHIVIATVRGANSSKYDELKKSATAAGTRLVVVDLDSSSVDEPAKAVEEIKAAGIAKIDIIIANAGIAPPPVPFNDASLGDIADCFNINAVSPIALYQAARPLLERSQQPKWLSISSGAGSIANLEAHQAHFVFAYGTSKAALNFFTLGLHASQPGVIAYSVHPGLVQTPLGDLGAEMMGLPEAPVTIEACCRSIMISLDNATREGTSGKFIDLAEGTQIPW